MSFGGQSLDPGAIDPSQPLKIVRDPCREPTWDAGFEAKGPATLRHAFRTRRSAQFRGGSIGMRLNTALQVAVVGLTVATVSSVPSVAIAGPYSLVATAASTSTISLRWGGSTVGWVNYVVERSITAASGFSQIATVGRALSYQDGGLASGRTYYYRIRETRQNALSNTASATTLAAQDRPPVANAGADQLTQVGVVTTFTGGGSDPDGTIMSYSWRFGDGWSASGRVVSHSYATSG